MDLEEVVMGPEEEEMDSEEVGMDSEEEEMDSEEAAMVLPEPEAVGMEVVGMALPEAVEMDSEEAVMVLPEPEVVRMEVVGMALPEAVEMVVVVEALPEAAGMEAAARVKPESEEGAIQGLEGEEGAVILVEEMVVKKEEEETLRNRPEIRRAVPAVEITVVAQGVEDLAAAASVKREKEEATPQEQLPRALPVRAVVEVVDSREAMVQSLRLVLAVKLVVAVAEKEEEVAAAATLRQF